MSIEGGKPTFRIADFIGWTDSDELWDTMVTPKMVKDFLESNKDAPEVVIINNSPGGYIYGGMEIANMLKEHDAKVTCYIVGIAASAGSLIAAACDRVVMMKASVAMLHAAHTLAIGNANDLLNAAERLEKETASAATIYKERMDDALVDEIMKGEKDWTFTPQEAVENGFADAIFEDEKDGGEEAEEAEINKDESSNGGAVPQAEAKRGEQAVMSKRTQARMSFLIAAMPD